MQVGLFQSIGNGMGAVGLALLLPLLLKCVRPKVVIVAAVLWNVISWTSYYFLAAGWQLYALAAASMLGGLYFPPVRASLTATFGEAHHGATSRDSSPHTPPPTPLPFSSPLSATASSLLRWRV